MHGGRIGHEHHVGLVDRLPATDRGTVEHDTIGEHVLVDGGNIHRHMLQLAAWVGKAKVNELYVVFLDLFHDFACARHYRFLDFSNDMNGHAERLDRVYTRFACADTDDLLDVGNEYLAVANPSSLCRISNRFDNGFGIFVCKNHFHLNLGQEVHDVFGAAVKFGMALLATETFGFGYRNTLQSDFLKGFLHFVELEGFNDRFDLLHEKLYLRFSPCAGRRPTRPCQCRYRAKLMLDFQKDILILHVFLSVSMPESLASTPFSPNSMWNDAAPARFVTEMRNLERIQSKSICTLSVQMNFYCSF
ncbi:hypothetical protein D3C80_748680 [compost metagenome]